MSDEAADPHSIFTGSQATANLVGWIDGVLMELREGRINDARAALEGETWRTARVESGIPRPILEQARESLRDAADALERGAQDDAETSLLQARSRFLPGG
ncbi:MAG TPA: hypothetical protein VF625_13485 [Longimicrobium sp.]|jgi:hypothetical protein